MSPGPRVVKTFTDHPWTSMVFVLLGFLVASVTTTVWFEVARDIYDHFRPVVSDWRVIESSFVENDLVVSGVLTKNRDCLFVPPIIARDALGRNYTVTSTSPTANKSWVPSDKPQHWGPWRVPDGAGKKLDFVIFYLCEGHPTASELGTFGKVKQ